MYLILIHLHFFTVLFFFDFCSEKVEDKDENAIPAMMLMKEFLFIACIGKFHEDKT